LPRDGSTSSSTAPFRAAFSRILITPPSLAARSEPKAAALTARSAAVSTAPRAAAASQHAPPGAPPRAAGANATVGRDGRGSPASLSSSKKSAGEK
jgi:hypothetical protein